MPNDKQKTKIIYYDNPCPDVYGFQPDCIDTPPFEFGSYAQLVQHCLQAYGQDIEFYEVTPDNWQRLYDSGAFG